MRPVEPHEPVGDSLLNISVEATPKIKPVTPHWVVISSRATPTSEDTRSKGVLYGCTGGVNGALSRVADELGGGTVAVGWGLKPSGCPDRDRLPGNGVVTYQDIC